MPKGPHSMETKRCLIGTWDSEASAPLKITGISNLLNYMMKIPSRPAQEIRTRYPTSSFQILEVVLVCWTGGGRDPG